MIKNVRDTTVLTLKPCLLWKTLFLIMLTLKKCLSLGAVSQ